MGAGTPENGFWPGGCTPDLRSAYQSMTTNAPVGFESHDTTDAPTNDNGTHRVLDLDAAEPASVPGATAIFAPTYARADDGHALRYSGDVPVACVGVYSETDARDALAECYAAENIDRAFRVGEWMHEHTPAHATAAVSHAESAIAADGGVDR